MADNQTHHVVNGRCVYCKKEGADTQERCPEAPGD